MTGAIVYRNAISMGTRLDVVLPEISEEIGDSIGLQIKYELKRIEDKISIYRESSNFSVLNRNAPLRPVKTDREIFLLIKELIGLSGRTLGYFDFGLGKLAEILKESGDIRSDQEALTGILSAMGVKNIVTDEATMTVSFKTDKIKLDSGGFGKGYGLDCVNKVLKSRNVDSAFISFGESSVLAYGNHPYGNAWKTGLQNIFVPDDSLFVFELSNEAMSVSGVTPQNIKKYGGGHIVDPHTGMPVNSFRQAAVAGSSGLVSEVVSTALLCATEESRYAIMQQFSDYRAVVIDYDDTNKPTITFSYNINNERSN